MTLLVSVFTIILEVALPKIYEFRQFLLLQHSNLNKAAVVAIHASPALNSMPRN